MKHTEILTKIQPVVTEILVTAAKKIESLYDEEARVTDSILIAKKTLKETQDSYSAIIEESKVINKAKRDAEETIQLASKRSIELAEAEAIAHVDVAEHAEMRESIKKDISKLEKVRDSLLPYQTELANCMKEIGLMSTKKKELEFDVMSLETKIITMSDYLITERKKFDESIKADRAAVLSLRAELEAKLFEIKDLQKNLVAKEGDLATIENRWKKLFGEKGLSFKV